jgi:putative transposase
LRWTADTRALTLAQMEAPLALRWSRPMPDGAEPSIVTVSRDPAGRSFASSLVEADRQPLPPVTRAVGIARGVHDVVLLDSGEKVGNPTCFHRDEPRLAKAHRRQARTQQGAKNRETARVTVSPSPASTLGSPTVARTSCIPARRASSVSTQGFAWRAGG